MQLLQTSLQAVPLRGVVAEETLVQAAQFGVDLPVGARLVQQPGAGRRTGHRGQRPPGQLEGLRQHRPAGEQRRRPVQGQHVQRDPQAGGQGVGQVRPAGQADRHREEREEQQAVPRVVERGQRAGKAPGAECGQHGDRGEQPGLVADHQVLEGGDRPHRLPQVVLQAVRSVRVNRGVAQPGGPQPVALLRQGVADGDDHRGREDRRPGHPGPQHPVVPGEAPALGQQPPVHGDAPECGRDGEQGHGDEAEGQGDLDAERATQAQEPACRPHRRDRHHGIQRQGRAQGPPPRAVGDSEQSEYRDEREAVLEEELIAEVQPCPEVGEALLDQQVRADQRGEADGRQGPSAQVGQRP